MTEREWPSPFDPAPEFDRLRSLTEEERERLARGDWSVLDEVPSREPTLDEEPPRDDTRGKWLRALPSSPRQFPEWALDAAAAHGVPAGFADEMTLLWVQGDARVISLDAHRAIIDQHEAATAKLRDDPDADVDEVTLTLERDLPPSLTGFIAWEPGQLWSVGQDRDGRELGGEARVFGWDFRPQRDARTNELIPDSGIVDVYTFVANPDLTNVWRHSMPAEVGRELMTGPPDGYVNIDPDGWGGRVLRPNDDDPYTNGRIVALNISATVAAAAVIWTLLAQGGLIETVTRTPGTRAARRRAAKRSTPDVELVRVRRRHVELVEALDAPEATEEEKADERSFRWVVSGHWRMQPHGPGGSLRKPVFIEPHLKGPEGAPIRRTRRRVLIL